jgi:hypothetical protein
LVDTCIDRISYLVGGKNDVLGLEQAGAQHVAKGVILLVKSEDRSGGKT